MPVSVRVLVLPGNDPQAIHLDLDFAAPECAEPAAPARASVEFGDGEVTQVGLVAAPTSVTWRTQHRFALAQHTYAGLGPYTLRALWGSCLVEIEVQPGIHPTPTASADILSPMFDTFVVEESDGRPLERVVRLKIRDLEPGQQLRLDGGAGQVHWLVEPGQAGEGWERRLTYSKTGIYMVALDLLDASGFWLRTLAEYPVEVSTWYPENEVRGGQNTTTGVPAILAGDQPSGSRSNRGGEQTFEPQAWLPHRHLRPLWGWLRTYTSPGGTTVARVLAMGTYLAVRAEMLVGNTLWYQTASQDWIPASVVDALRPAQLRGVELSGTEPGTGRASAWLSGVSTAALLNVRPRPGVRADNPPLERLRQGTALTIYDEVHCGESTWYCIGIDQWVYGTYVHLTDGAERGAAMGESWTSAVRLPLGWVNAPLLNVRARPGIATGNPPIDLVTRHEVLPIMDTCLLGNVPWYAIAENRWVEGTWVNVARSCVPPAGIAPDERWLAVCQIDQIAVAYEGERPVYAALVATGLAGTPTPNGLFRVFRRVEVARLTGGSPAWGSYYDLEDVPWILYFHSGYSLLGCYWHEEFGRPHSHGCVNFSPYDAWWIYQWTPERMPVYIY